MRFLLTLPLTLALATLLKLVTAYQVEIHPEYQQGLAINDVPAERRLHWMRVANEVGRRVLHARHDQPALPFVSRGSSGVASSRAADSESY
jgi:hypothetical protein